MGLEPTTSSLGSVGQLSFGWTVRRKKAEQPR